MKWTPTAVRLLRRGYGMSQSQFAIMLGMGGRPSTVSDWEKGRKAPSPIATTALERAERRMKRREAAAL